MTTLSHKTVGFFLFVCLFFVLSSQYFLVFIFSSDRVRNACQPLASSLLCPPNHLYPCPHNPLCSPQIPPPPPTHPRPLTTTPNPPTARSDSLLPPHLTFALPTLLCPWSRKSQPTSVGMLGNSVDRGAWQATVHGVAKNQTLLSD